MALHAGIDVELPSTDCYSTPLQEAIESNMVATNKLDEGVGRVLTLKFELGLFENPYVDVDSAKSVFDSPEQRDLAYRIAQKSIVLLKNDDNLLPLDKNINSIAVIGPNADTVRNIIGDYAYPCHIETLVEMRDEDNVFDMPVPEGFELVDDFVSIISILDGLKDKVSNHTTIHYAKGCSVLGDSKEGFAEAITTAEKADVAIVVVGGKSGLTNDCTCGESRDRADLNLTGVQQELVETVAATGKPVVVLLLNGRPLSINWIAENIPAIVEAWLPGEEGAAAVADVLFGDMNPGGKLPMTFPRSVGQVPIFYNHKPSGGRSHWNGSYINLSNKPLWPFGHGLSYTQFELRNLQVDKSSAQAGETVTVQCDLTNVGQHAGDEVIQLYTRDAVASVIRPVKELKGFKRIHLAPQETKTVTFELNVNQFGFYDRNMDYIVEPGAILLMIGTSSEAIQLEGEFTISGDVTEIGQDKVFFSHVE